jgi:hypothetical protein
VQGCKSTLLSCFLVADFEKRTFRELDVMFEAKVPARKFKSTEVALDSDNHEERQP